MSVFFSQMSQVSVEEGGAFDLLALDLGRVAPDDELVVRGGVAARVDGEEATRGVDEDG